MESADNTTFFQWFIFWNIVMTIIDLVSTLMSRHYGYGIYTIRRVIISTFTLRPFVIFIVMIMYGVIKAAIRAYGG